MKTRRNTVITILVFWAAFASCKQPLARQNSYTVVYNANGGSGTVPSARTVPAGDSVILPGGDGLKKGGYFFDGWNTNTFGTGTSLKDGSSYTPTGDITLFAMWNTAAAITYYTVTFRANGGSGEVPPDQTVQIIAGHGGGIVLSGGDGLTRDGFTFGGWSADPSGTGVAHQSNGYFVLTGDTILYAKWDAIIYTVTFDASGGSGTAPVRQTVNAGSGIILPGADGLSKSGFIFGGWFTGASGTVSNYRAGDAFTPVGSITLYARWDPDAPIPLIENIWVDGSMSSASPYVWYSFNVTSGTTYCVWLKIHTNNLYASISAVYLNGSDIFAYTGNNYPYSFTADADGTVYLWVTRGANFGIFSIAYSADDTRPNACTVIFDANGLGGTVPDHITVSAGSGITLSGGSRDGYMFIGWNTESGGTGDFYSAGDIYTPILPSSTDAVTLYAQWIVNYTVTFSDNYGSGELPDPITVTAGSGITIPGGSGLSRPLYTFGGWITGASGTVINYRDGDFYTPTDNITLYAEWLPVPGTAGGVIFDIEQIIDGAPLFADITISRTNSGYPLTYGVYLGDVSNVSDFDSIEWRVAGVGIYAFQFVTGAGSSFTLNAGNTMYNSLGGHVLTLTVTKGGQRYQRAIPFTIVR